MPPIHYAEIRKLFPQDSLFPGLSKKKVETKPRLLFSSERYYSGPQF